MRINPTEETLCSYNKMWLHEPNKERRNFIFAQAHVTSRMQRMWISKQKRIYNILEGSVHRENQSAEAAAINTVCKLRRRAGGFIVSEFAPISLTEPFRKEHCCLDSSILFGKVLWVWLAQFRNKVIPQRRLSLIYEGSQSSTCCL